MIKLNVNINTNERRIKMNKIKTKIIAILAAVTVILSSCSSKTNEQPNVSSTPS